MLLPLDQLEITDDFDYLRKMSSVCVNLELKGQSIEDYLKENVFSFTKWDKIDEARENLQNRMTREADEKEKVYLDKMQEIQRLNEALKELKEETSELNCEIYEITEILEKQKKIAERVIKPVRAFVQKNISPFIQKFTQAKREYLRELGKKGNEAGATSLLFQKSEDLIHRMDASDVFAFWKIAQLPVLAVIKEPKEEVPEQRKNEAKLPEKYKKKQEAWLKGQLNIFKKKQAMKETILKARNSPQKEINENEFALGRSDGEYLLAITDYDLKNIGFDSLKDRKSFYYALDMLKHLQLFQTEKEIAEHKKNCVVCRCGLLNLKERDYPCIPKENDPAYMPIHLFVYLSLENLCECGIPMKIRYSCAKILNELKTVHLRALEDC